jgi:hypothetical protein
MHRAIVEKILKAHKVSEITSCGLVSVDRAKKQFRRVGSSTWRIW